MRRSPPVFSGVGPGYDVGTPTYQDPVVRFRAGAVGRFVSQFRIFLALAQIAGIDEALPARDCFCPLVRSSDRELGASPSGSRRRTAGAWFGRGMMKSPSFRPRQSRAVHYPCLRRAVGNPPSHRSGPRHRGLNPRAAAARLYFSVEAGFSFGGLGNQSVLRSLCAS